MRVLIALLATVLAVAPATVSSAEETGPPYDHDSGLADAQTGTIGAAMTRTGVPRNLGYPSVQAGSTGFVGIQRSMPAAELVATATVEVAVEAAYADPDAAVCIQLAGEGLPNNIEGGGPVCEFFGEDPEPPVHLQGFERLQLFVRAFSEHPRAVNAEVFASWKQPHPAETGGVGTVARVVKIDLSARSLTP